MTRIEEHGRNPGDEEYDGNNIFDKV